MDRLPFSYYGKDTPDEGDYVLARVLDYLDNGIQLQLLEYKGDPCVINYRDASKTARILKIKAELKKGRDYTFYVKSVDEETGYLELIRRDLTEADDKKYFANLEGYRFLLSLMNSFFIQQNISDLKEQEVILGQTIWQYERDGAFPIFQEIYRAERSCSDCFPELASELVQSLESLIKVKLQNGETVDGIVYFKLMSYEIDGVERIRNFLQNLEKITGIPVFLKSSPDYYYALNGVDKRDVETKELGVRSLFASFPNDGVIVRYEKIEWTKKI